ncbi:lipoate-protein ligase A [Microbacteriaceae bacterium MWH-Ta3]|nr:lipoate-protein ligase A [Microbacteriaceae bacterium MWH-Ta3]
MRGEYKVPGGKLVIVEFDAADGVITNAALSGDFFLEPDEALADIQGALNGLATSATAQDIANAVRAATSDDVVMLGFSPEAVGTAVRRAIAHARSFEEFEWELVTAPPLSPAMHLALDQVLTEELGAGRRGPTLRIWDWAESAIILGSFQSLSNEVDMPAALARKVPVYRRISGGGAMFIELGSGITHSLYAPAELVQGMSFADSYAFLDDWLIQTLRDLGIAAEYKPLNDIASAAGKIGGAAQKRLGSGAVLHHVTMAYDMDGDAMAKVLRIGREKLSDKGVASANKRVDPLKSQTGLTREAIVEAMIDSFRARYGLTVGSITPDEMARAEELAATKFTSAEWLHRVP